MAAVGLSCSPTTYTPNCLISTLVNSSWLLHCGKTEPRLTFHSLCTDFKVGHVSYFSLYPTVALLVALFHILAYFQQFLSVKIRKFENNSKGPTSSPPPSLYPNETKSEYSGVFIGTEKSPTPWLLLISSPHPLRRAIRGPGLGCQHLPCHWVFHALNNQIPRISWYLPTTSLTSSKIRILSECCTIM